MSTAEAAAALGLSVPTVRTRIEDGQLKGTRETIGSRFRWRVDREDVERLARELDESAGSASSSIAASGVRALRNEVAELQAQVDQLRQVVEQHHQNVPGTTNLASSPDVRVTHEVVLQQRAIVDSVLQADEARAEVMRLLINALQASETADEYRRRAQRAADALAGQFLVSDTLPRPD